MFCFFGCATSKSGVDKEGIWEGWNKKDKHIVRDVLGGLPTPGIPKGHFKTVSEEESKCSKMAREYVAYRYFCELHYDCREATKKTGNKYVYVGPDNPCKKARKARNALSLMYDAEVVNAYVDFKAEFSATGRGGTWTEGDIKRILDAMTALPSDCD